MCTIRTPDMNPIYIDVYGERVFDQYTVTLQSCDVHFIAKDELKRGKRFACGLFLDRACVRRNYQRYPKNRRYALLVESPLTTQSFLEKGLHPYYHKVFACWKGLVDGFSNAQLFYYGTTWLGDVDALPSVFPKEKLCSFIGSLNHPQAGGYAMRRSVYEHIKDHAEVDAYGLGIKPIEGKLEALGRYRFSICMENTQEDYYFTEKLLDCFFSDTVPIYWGGSGIGDVFDSRGILQFHTMDDLQKILSSLNAELYQKMLPFVRKNKDLALKEDFARHEGIYRRMAKALIEEKHLFENNRTNFLRNIAFDVVEVLRRRIHSMRAQEGGMQS